MAEETTHIPQVPPEAPAGGTPPPTPPRDGQRGRGPVRGRGGSRHGGGRGPRRDDRPRSEFDQKVVSVRRVARVIAGGRRFTFSVTMIVGNRKGSVGVGLGKGADTAVAMEKATRHAKKNMIKIPLTKTGSIPHEVAVKYAASQVYLKPAPDRGIVAGSSARAVLELGGVKDVSAKLLSRSKNSFNNARALIKALSELRVAK